MSLIRSGAVPADLAAQRDALAEILLVAGAEVVDVEVPDVDLRRVPLVDQVEDVVVGPELLAEEVVGRERDPWSSGGLRSSASTLNVGR